MNVAHWIWLALVCLAFSDYSGFALEVGTSNLSNGFIRMTVPNGSTPPFDLFVSTNVTNPQSWKFCQSGGAGQNAFDVPATNPSGFFRVQRQFGVTGTNLFIQIGSGTIFNALWNARIAGGQLRMQPSTTNYAMIDLRDLSLHVWGRNIDRGSICVATIVTGPNAIKSITPATSFDIPKTRLPITRAKLAANQPVRVLLVGDSLTMGVGSSAGDHWFNLLFDASGFSNTASLHATNISYVNAGMAGAVARWGMAVLGDSDKGQPSGFVTPTPDLALVCFGANALSTTQEEYGYIETIVRTLRRKKIEVILWNGDYPLWGDPKIVHIQASNYRLIADRHGAEFIDTCVRTAELNLNPDGSSAMNTYIDVVHQNSLGQQCQANSFKSLFSIPQETEVILPTDTRLLLGVTANWFPNRCLISFTPCDGNVSQSAPTPNSENSLAVVTGGKNVNAAGYATGTGTNVVFHFQRACDVDIVAWTGVDATMESFATDGDWTGFEIGDVPLARWSCFLQTLVGRTNFLNLPSPYPFAHIGAGALVTSNAINIEAAVGFGFDGYVVPESEVIFRGPFNVETELGMLKRRWHYCDSTNNASITIPFKGNGLHLLFQSGNAAGIIQCQVDGQTVLTKNLCNAASLGHVKSVQLWAPGLNATTPLSDQYGDHLAQITLIGVDSASGNPGVENHRFALQEAYAIDAR